ncbi:RNA 3'-terminal phosphate cyclase-like isoform X2 [Xenia sp. Carnegie-2017]|uniref:RNA 3'-terminal phosphate cyclase-like isoform X2 n=1 Tax=Xenia sp. Carnegie-2017 TaxID=2897299 RepID=UPI001F037049|nr:RNA 3'-terminal phosphate cyclase-like isoform X2 [Xenia sp. Carnegie-2017]
MEGETFICHLASLSSILGKPFRVTNICHHAVIRGIPANEMRIMILLRQLCNGSLSGSRGSKTMTFLPSDVQAGKFYVDAYQFGNVCDIIPFSILCMMFAPSPNLGKYNILFLNGPTYTFNGLHIDHIAKVYLPVMKNFGMSFEIEVKKRGYLPYGRGRIVTKSKPIFNFQSIDLTMPGMVVKITGRAFVAGGKPIKIAQKMARQALKSLKKRFNDIPIMIDSARELDSRSEGMGQGILLVAETSTSCVFSGSGLWKKGVDTDDIVEMAISELLSNTNSGGCVDSWMQDKVITAMALAHGESVVLFGSLTPQAKAAIKALRILTKVRIQVIKQSHSPEVNIVKCKGLGFTNLYLNKSAQLSEDGKLMED